MLEAKIGGTVINDQSRIGIIVGENDEGWEVNDNGDMVTWPKESIVRVVS